MAPLSIWDGSIGAFLLPENQQEELKMKYRRPKGTADILPGRFRKMAIYRKKGTCIIQKISLSGNENADF